MPNFPLMEAKIYLEGEVGPREYGYPVNYGVLSDFFNENQDATSYTIELNGPGGDVYEGLAIRGLIQKVAQNKPVKTVAVNVASIMTVIFLAGSEREAYPNAGFMIHNPWGVTSGDAAEHEKRATQLREIESTLLDIYTERTGADRDTIADLMGVETYLTETQLLSLGFVDRIQTGETVTAKRQWKAVALIHPKSNQANQAMSDNNSIGQQLKDFKEEVKAMLSPAKALELSLADGQTIKIKTKEDAPKIGDSVNLLVDGRNEAITDGTYLLSDNTRNLVVANGKIEDIENRVGIEPETLGLEDVKAMLSAAVEAVGESFTAQVSALNDEIKAMNERLNEAQALNEKSKATYAEIKAQLDETKQELVNAMRATSSTFNPAPSNEPNPAIEEKQPKPEKLEGVTLMNMSEMRKMQGKQTRKLVKNID